MATISASFGWEPGRNTFGTASLQRRLSTTLDALDLMLHPKQGVARDTRTTEVLYGGAAETTVPAVRSGVRCQHNARSANLRGCRADGNDSLDFHPRRRPRRSLLRRLLFLHNRPIDSDLSCLVVDDDVIRVRNWLWPRRAIAGALGEDVSPVFLIFDSGLEKLHGCRSPVGFGAYQQVQKILLRTAVAIGCSDGDFAQNSLYDGDPLYPIAFTDCNASICLLDRQGLYAIFESDSGLAA